MAVRVRAERRTFISTRSGVNAHHHRHQEIAGEGGGDDGGRRHACVPEAGGSVAAAREDAPPHGGGRKTQCHLSPVEPRRRTQTKSGWEGGGVTGRQEGAG